MFQIAAYNGTATNTMVRPFRAYRACVCTLRADCNNAATFAIVQVIVKNRRKQWKRNAPTEWGLSDDYWHAWRKLGIPHPSTTLYWTDHRDEIRVSTYFRWLERQDIDSNLFDRILNLIEYEPTSQTSMRIALMHRCSDEDLPKLLDLEDMRKWVEEETALRRLDHELTEDELLELVDFPSGKVHRKLLEMPITPAVLEALAKKGAAKAIRNRAHTKLGRRGPAPDS